MDAAEFKKFSFVSMTGPGTWGVVAVTILLGVLLGLISDTALEGRLLIDPWTFAAGFVFICLASGFLETKLLRGFKEKWAYLTVLVSEALFIGLSLLFTISSKITLFDSWVLWTAMCYTLWMLVLSGLGSARIGVKAMLMSFIQPVLTWAWLLLSMRIVASDLMTPIILMGVGITISTLVIIFTERIFSLVFTGMSGMVELSKFLKGVRGEQVALDIGHNIDALVQYMKFRAAGREHVILAPWLHSGPIRSVGGGNLSTQCIEKLNDRYSDSYLMHVPSNHEYNPSAKVASRVVASVGQEAYAPLMVSDVIEVKKGDLTVMGQRFNDTYLLSFSSKRIDDYDISIFYSLREKSEGKKILFIDSHPNFPMAAEENVEAFTKDADTIAGIADEALAKLSEAQLSPAKTGIAMTNAGPVSVFALSISSKKDYLYFIADANGFTPSERDSLESIAKKAGVDRLLLFTTDTHSLSIKALISRPDAPRKTMEEVIKKAMENAAPAEFAYGESVLRNVRIFGKTYYELVTLVKIMSRVIPVMFVLLFIFLTIMLWIF